MLPKILWPAIILFILTGTAANAKQFNIIGYDSIASKSGITDSALVRIAKAADPSSLFGILASAPAKLQLPLDAVDRMRIKFQKLVNSSRYMEHDCIPSACANWEGFPLIKCSYNVKDSDGTIKNTKVIMLNPSPLQLARWVVTACLIVKCSADSIYTDQLYKHIRIQSGAQFPVAGIVYEDMEGDGKYKIYCFRDGVTVKVKGIQHAGIKPLSEEEINTSLYGEIDSSWTGQFARIQSTTREQYRAIGGNADVGDKENRKTAWLNVVRELYKSAWEKDVNILLIAWAYANLK